MAAQIITDTEQSVDNGLDTASDRLKDALAQNPVDAATVMALDSLRSRYVFDKMQMIRARIIQLDNSPAVVAAVAGLTQAKTALDQIQAKSAATTQWVNQASGALDATMDAVNKVKAAVGV